LRRNWIKLYVDQTLRGSCFDELLPDERFVWFGFLLLAGDNALEGKICITEKMGYTNEQLAGLLRCKKELIERSIKKMIKVDKVKLYKNNVIKVINWQKYQSEYQRQKPYRSNPELQDEVTDKVTTKSDTLEREGDIEGERDKKEKKNKEIIKEIINHLNLKAKKNFRPTSAIAIKNITARLNEKYTIEQFKKVVDIKCSHWLELKDGELVGVIVIDKDTGKKQDMSIYLSPDTLFGNKFEKYLNQNANKEAIQEAVKHEKDWQKIKEVRPEETYKYKPIPEEANKIIIKAIPTYRDKKRKE